MDKIKRQLTKSVTLHDVIDKTTVNGITISRVVFDFDSDCVQISFGVGNIDAGDVYKQVKRQGVTKTTTDFSTVMDPVVLQKTLLDYVETLIDANMEN